VQYNLDEPIDRLHSDSAKWGHFDPDVLPLWVADMDFRSPEPVVRALQERVAHGVFGYTFDPRALRQAVQARLETLYDWKVAGEDILFMPGVVAGFTVACHAIGEAGDGVLVQPPIYPPCLSMPVHAGRTLQCAQVRRQGPRYEIDMDEFEAAIGEQTRLFLFCNPHNPVGRVYERDELARLAEICLRHNLVICSDEIHCDLVFSGHRHTPIASLAPEIAQRSITLMAPSKTFNIAGLHCSFAVIQNPDLRQAFSAAAAGLSHGANLLGYVAALAAYRDGQEWLDQVLAYLEANRDLLRDYVAGHLPGIHMVVPEGTYLAWLDCRDTSISGQPGQFFSQQARVALNEGATFGLGGEGFVRLNFGCTRSTLVSALDRMRDALARCTCMGTGS
jgi:cysteine-S-conjugate beta-lyase